MNIFTAIRNHSERWYYFLQALLGANLCAASFAMLARSGTEWDTQKTLLAFCLATLPLGVALLIYLRRSLSYRLNQASIAEEEKQRLIQSDALTGAATRRFFLEELKAGLGNPLASRPATLLLVDVDHFKQLNDSFGHPFGDAVLVHLVRTIRQVFPNSLVGRLGGDEFAVLVGHDDAAVIRERTQRLLEELQQGKQRGSHPVAISTSIGAAMSPVHASQSGELMLLADLALYESKAAGRGRLTIFDSDMLSEQRHRRFIERELRAAIYLNQLELHYQPIIGSDGTVHAVEGLIRWRHPIRGIISPADFVPVAERSSLIDTMGAWVFRRACTDTSHFPGMRISINVSGEQLKRDVLVTTLEGILKETGCSADQFVLEITETAATAATPDVLERLATLRNMGFRIALDDFGTGHCGFNYLKTLPIDSIKIDRSYIRSLGHDDVARVFVSALTEIARIQDKTIVAEGIERMEELELAKAAGCTRFQGYYISRPAPKEQLSWLMSDRGRRLPARDLGQSAIG